jgi:tetratricopeptide (TPR) repeat protein
MTVHSSIDGSPAQKYARFLLELHKLSGQGKEETEEAEAIRDLMDSPWNDLGQTERDRLNGLSEDLYALGESRNKCNGMSKKENMELGAEIQRGFLANDWDKTLCLLRSGPPAPPGMISFMQARCWEKLGYLEVAFVFAQEAERLNPGEYAVVALHYLQQLGRSDQALAYANRIIELDTQKAFMAIGAFN